MGPSAREQSRRLPGGRVSVVAGTLVLREPDVLRPGPGAAEDHVLGRAARGGRAGEPRVAEPEDGLDGGTPDGVGEKPTEILLFEWLGEQSGGQTEPGRLQEDTLQDLACAQPEDGRLLGGERERTDRGLVL